MTARFQRGTCVRLRTTQQQGVVEGEPIYDNGEYWYRVRFDRKVSNSPEQDLEPVVEDESLEGIVLRGSWGNLQAFCTSLSVERIRHANQNTLYSYRAQRILFEPYQYRPLIKLLGSSDKRLLIADEVGLGKTVEAGLILAELEARRSGGDPALGQNALDRVLIVCPSRLREKWRNELSRKFESEFEIFTRRDLESWLDRVRRSPGRRRLRAIASMQSVRSPEFRERLLLESDGLDLLIVDEAHHARNPSTQTAEMLKELCEASTAVILLTATPLHLGNRDLFTLLNALRPTEFSDPTVFDDRLRLHSAIHEAELQLRQQTSTGLREARRLIQTVFGNSGDSSAAALLVRDLAGDPPVEGKEWIELERRVQDLHPLASVLTRTRKRDVQEAAVRRAKVLPCTWTEEEKRAYATLVEGASGLGWFNGPASFGQIQRARQAASCLPAALAAKNAKHLDDDDAAEQLDIAPSELEGLYIATDSIRPATPTLISHDSKFEKLLELLKEVRAGEPDAKFLVFTYFVGTSRYLAERLTAAGFPALRIAGDVPSDPKRPEHDVRGQMMHQFRENPTISVLVSTEVGSEGLDFQFCNNLVNYDLPWNPMVVEQRIGRVDRFGQRSKFVRVLSLVVEGTVEERILAKLYDRIGLFESSIGQVEAILGDVMRDLQKDYILGRLTEEEAERRFEEAERAVLERKVRLDELEKHAASLFGHEQYIREQLNQVRHQGRYISARAMLAVIRTWLDASHPSVRIWEEPKGVYHLKLTNELRMDVQRVCDPENQWIPRDRRGELTFCFDGVMAYHHPEFELLNASHPMVLAAVRAITGQLAGMHSRTARAIIDLPGGDRGRIPTGLYFLWSFMHDVEGLRSRRELDTVGLCLPGGELLAADDAERLLHLVQESGLEPPADETWQAVSAAQWNVVESEARRRNSVLKQSEARESASLHARRKSIIQAEFEHELKLKQRRLETARERGHTKIVPLHEAQIARTRARFEDRLAEIERLKTVGCSWSPPIAACLALVRHMSLEEL